MVSPSASRRSSTTASGCSAAGPSSRPKQRSSQTQPDAGAAGNGALRRPLKPSGSPWRRPGFEKEEGMDSNLLIILAVLAVLVVAGLLLYSKRRSDHLRDRFGPEYDHQLGEAGSRRKAEANLAERERRVAKLDIRPLSPADQDQFLKRWTDVQARFVDDPPRAVDYADALL